MEDNYNSLGLEGNQEKYDENVRKFLNRIDEFKSKSWDSIGEVVDVSVTNFVLLEHFLSIIVTKLIQQDQENLEKKSEEVFENLLNAFTIYKDDILNIKTSESDYNICIDKLKQYTNKNDEADHLYCKAIWGN